MQRPPAATRTPQLFRPFLPIGLWALHPLYWVDARLFACHVNALVPSPSSKYSYFLGPHPLSKAEIAGTVVEASLKRDRQVLQIDDGTGRVQAAVYLTYPDGSLTEHLVASVGDLVVVCGKLSWSYRNGAIDESCRQIRARVIRRLGSPNDLCAHWLETTRLHAEQYCLPLSHWLPPSPAVLTFLSKTAGLPPVPVAPPHARLCASAAAAGGGAGAAGTELLGSDDPELEAIRGYVWEAIASFHPWYTSLAAAHINRLPAWQEEEAMGMGLDTAQTQYVQWLTAGGAAALSQPVGASGSAAGAGAEVGAASSRSLEPIFSAGDVCSLLRVLIPRLFEVTGGEGQGSEAAAAAAHGRIDTAVARLVEEGLLYQHAAAGGAAPASSSGFSATAVTGGPWRGGAAAPFLAPAPAAGGGGGGPSGAASPSAARFGLMLEAVTPALLGVLRGDPADLLARKRPRFQPPPAAGAAPSSYTATVGEEWVARPSGSSYTWSSRQMITALQRIPPFQVLSPVVVMDALGAHLESGRVLQTGKDSFQLDPETTQPM